MLNSTYTLFDIHLYGYINQAILLCDIRRSFFCFQVAIAEDLSAQQECEILGDYAAQASQLRVADTPFDPVHAAIACSWPGQPSRHLLITIKAKIHPCR